MFLRGHRFEEIDALNFHELHELWIMDTYLEPQGPNAEEMRTARLIHSNYMTSPNMSAKAAKGIKVSDFTNVGKSVFKTQEEIIEENQTKQKSAMELIFGDTDLLTQLKSEEK